MGLRLVQGFLVFALGGGGEGGEAGELAAGDEPKHDFGGDENGDECSDCDYWQNRSDLVCQNASRPPIAGRPGLPTPQPLNTNPQILKRYLR